MARQKKLKSSHKLLIGLLALVVVSTIGFFLFKDANFAVLNPKGTIAAKQRNLMIFASLLSLTVVLPVFFMMFYFAWKYRASNVKAKYRPDWDHSVVAETIWWLVPTALILVLSAVTWRSSHELDPFRHIESDVKPLKVQVVALQWKWLFIYPEQNVASVNHLQLPVNTPVEFEITSDAPMNSFWIPQLGGQIYAMPGMSTNLHLMAGEAGVYEGSSANISGEGFAGMKFKTEVGDQRSFDDWVAATKHSDLVLDVQHYVELAVPSVNQNLIRYSSSESGLYDKVVMKYMHPDNTLEYTVKPLKRHH